MRKRLIFPSFAARSLVAFICLFYAGQMVNAADFVVTTRESVLELTSKIQATQFLTHATFGATSAEVDALATSRTSISSRLGKRRFFTIA